MQWLEPGGLFATLRKRHIIAVNYLRSWMGAPNWEGKTLPLHCNYRRGIADESTCHYQKYSRGRGMLEKWGAPTVATSSAGGGSSNISSDGVRSRHRLARAVAPGSDCYDSKARKRGHIGGTKAQAYCHNSHCISSMGTAASKRRLRSFGRDRSVAG